MLKVSKTVIFSTLTIKHKGFVLSTTGDFAREVIVSCRACGMCPSIPVPSYAWNFFEICLRDVGFCLSLENLHSCWYWQGKHPLTSKEVLDESYKQKEYFGCGRLWGMMLTTRTLFLRSIFSECVLWSVLNRFWKFREQTSTCSGVIASFRQPLFLGRFWAILACLRGWRSQA